MIETGFVVLETGNDYDGTMSPYSSISDCVTFCVTAIVTYQFTLKYCFHVALYFSLLQIESNMNKLF